MAIKNTTDLGIGIDGSISSTVGRKVDELISRENVDNAILDKASSINRLIETTTKLFSKYPLGEKIRLLQEYGAIGRLPANPTEDAVTLELVKTIISVMPKHELTGLIQKQQASERKLQSSVHKLTNNRSSDNLSKQILGINIANSKMLANNKSADIGTGSLKTLMKSISNDIPGSTKIKNSLVNQYKDLDNQLTKLFKDYSSKEIASLYIKIGGTNYDAQSRKFYVRQIINKVIIYVATIASNNTSMSNQFVFDSSEISIIEDLLMMTSYSWVTGKISLSVHALKHKRELAKKARRAERISSDTKYSTRLSQYRGMVSRDKYGDMILDSKGRSIVKYRSGELTSSLRVNEINNRRIELERSGILNNISERELLALASKYGIADVSNLDSVRSQLYTFMATEASATNSLQRSSDRWRRFSKFNRAFRRKADDYANAAKMSSDNQMLNDIQVARNGRSGFSTETPIVTLSSLSDLETLKVTHAVPVIVVGETNLLSTDGTMHVKRKDRRLEQSIKTVNDIASKSGNIFKNTNNIDVQSYMTRKESVLNWFKKLSENSDKTAKQLLSSSSQIDAAKEVGDLSIYDKGLNIKKPSAKKNLLKSSSSRIVRITALQETLSNMAYANFGKFKMRVSQDTPTPVTPVYMLNKILPDVSIFNQMHNTLGGIYNQVQIISNTLPGLQSAGATVNGVAATYAAALAMYGSNELISATADPASNTETLGYSAFATGGSMKASNAVSSIITGDSRTQKYNPEMVSVDWNSKKINVKPLMQTTPESGISNVKRLTSSERNTPMVVNLASGLVKYDTVIKEGYTDDGNHTAIKVYSINNSISEKVDIGGKSISLAELVYGVYAGVSSIATSNAINSEYLKTIATNTSRNYNSTNNSGSNSSGGNYNFPTNLDNILAGN